MSKYITLFRSKQEGYSGESLVDAVNSGKNCISESEYLILMFTPASPDTQVIVKDYDDPDPNVIKCKKCGDEIVFVKSQLKNIPVNTNTWAGERSLVWKHTVHTITCRGKR